jgi:siderophore synthetase component
MGLSLDEVRAYAPEHRPVVRLALVDVPPGRWCGTGPPVLAVHPWQRDHVLDRYPFLTPSGRELIGRPLMSLRTLSLDPRHHVKTAVDVQMTSAVRIVSPAAVHNGPVVSGLLVDLARSTPTLAILPEPEAGAVLVDGEPSRSLGVIHRYLPGLPAGDLALPLAALAAPSPADGRPIAAELVRLGYGGDAGALIAALAGLLLPPLFALLEFGIALEAHGQNLLAVVRDHRPVRLLYRDFGGVRISPYRLARHGREAPDLRGDLVADDPDVLRTKLLAALTTVLGELVAVLARCTDLDPADGWRRIAEVWGPRRHEHADGPSLFAPTLPVKATTAMRLSTQPLDDIWAQVPNPLAGQA